MALVAATALGIPQLDGAGRLIIIIAAVAYLFGAQLPTVAINVPLNNRVQTLDIDTMDETMQGTEREHFEPRWNRWNAIRTTFASLASALLTVLLFIL